MDAAKKKAKKAQEIASDILAKYVQTLPMDKKKTDSQGVRINVWISRQSYANMSSLSEVDHRTISDLVREALRDYIDRHSHRTNLELLSPEKVLKDEVVENV